MGVPPEVGLEPVEGPEVDGLAVDGLAVDRVLVDRVLVDGVLVDGVAVGTAGVLAEETVELDGAGVGLMSHEVVGMKVGVTNVTESPSFVIPIRANTNCVLFIRSTMTRIWSRRKPDSVNSSE